MGEPQSYSTVQVALEKQQAPTALTGNVTKELQFSREKISLKNLSSISKGKIAPLSLAETRLQLLSHGDSLHLKERLHYYRLCYLFFRGKKITHKLQGDIEDGLGNGAEQEAFYKQYQMSDELVTHYLRLGEYKKAADELEKKGDPDKAWQVITEHTNTFLLRKPLDEARIRNYIRAQDFLAILGTFPGDAFLPSAGDPGEPGPWTYYGRAGKFWGDFALTVNNIFWHPVSYDSIHLTGKWMKQFLDITVSDPT